MTERLRVGIACNASTQELYFSEADLERLGRFADVEFQEFDVPGPTWAVPPHVPELEERLIALRLGPRRADRLSRRSARERGGHRRLPAT